MVPSENRLMRLSVVGQRALHFQRSAPKLRGFHADFCGDKQNSGEISTQSLACHDASTWYWSIGAA